MKPRVLQDSYYNLERNCRLCRISFVSSMVAAMNKPLDVHINRSLLAQRPDLKMRMINVLPNPRRSFGILQTRTLYA